MNASRLNQHQLPKLGIFARRLAVFLGALGLALSAASEEVDAGEKITVEVVDENGQPVSEAEALFTKYRSDPWFSWHPVRRGHLDLQTESPQQSDWFRRLRSGHLIVRSPGYASAVQKVDLPATAPLRVVLKKGKKVELAIHDDEGRPIADSLVPRIANADLYLSVVYSIMWLETSEAGLDQSISIARPERKGAGRFAFQYDPSWGELYVMLHDREFVRGMISGPFKLEELETGKITIDVPKLASMQVEYDASEAAEPDDVTTISLMRTVQASSGGRHGITLASEVFHGPKAETTFTNLPPESYSVEAISGVISANRQPPEPALKPGERREVVLKPAEPLPKIIAIDAKTSTPLQDAMASVYKRGVDYPVGAWYFSEEEGEIRIPTHHFAEDLPGRTARGRYSALVRAPGYAPSVVRFRVPTTSSQVIAPLVHGREVAVKLELPRGMQLPDDALIIAHDGNPMWKNAIEKMLRYGNERARGSVAEHNSIFEVKRSEDDNLSIRVPDATQKLHLIIDAPEVLRWFSSEVIDLAEAGAEPITIQVPETRKAVARIDTSTIEADPKTTEVALSATLKTSFDVNGERWEFATETSAGQIRDGVARFGGLAPQNYRIEAVASALAGGQRGRSTATADVPMTTGSVAKMTLKLGQIVAQDSTSRLDYELPSVGVVDESGGTPPDVELFARAKGQEFNPLTPVYDGKRWDIDSNVNSAQIKDLKGGGELEILARAPGYASVLRTVSVPTSDTDVLMTLPKGKPVELRLRTEDGRAIPEDLRPIFFDEKFAVPAWMSIQSDMVRPRFSTIESRSLGGGRFEFHVDEETTGLYVLIHHPGFLRAFQAGPFDADELSTGRIDVDLPEPGTVAVRFEPGPDFAADPPYGESWAEISKQQELPGDRNWSFGVAKEESESPRLELTWEDLPPGQYTVSVGEGFYKDRYYGPERPFSKRKSATLDEGSSVTVAMQYEQFDPGKLRGDYTAKVKVSKLDGEPASGQPYKLTYRDSTFGEKTVAEGTLDESGRAEIANLAGGPDEATSVSELRESGKLPPRYNFEIAGSDVGVLGFFKIDDEIVHPEHQNKTRSFEFTMPPKEGDPAPDIELVEVFGEGKVKLSDFHGKVVFLDFWTTWCGPCQDPMRALNDLAKKRGAEWDDSVALIGASMDDDRDTVAAHVKKNDWTAVRQLWCGEGGWSAAPAQKYGVRSVPTAFLIGRDGKILWRGHPGNFDKETKILEALARD